jgi:hypothetical protein
MARASGQLGAREAGFSGVGAGAGVGSGRRVGRGRGVGDVVGVTSDIGSVGEGVKLPTTTTCGVEGYLASWTSGATASDTTVLSR